MKLKQLTCNWFNEYENKPYAQNIKQHYYDWIN